MPEDETPKALRQISDEELKQVLEDHLRWVESEGKESKQADLSYTDLQGRDLKVQGQDEVFLQNAHLEGAFLRGAHLKGANLAEAYFEGADLSETHLEWADLEDAHLKGADLSEAHLEGAHLSDAHLEEAVLNSAHLEEADLSGANLKAAILKNAHLEEADLSGAHLEEADFMFAHLEGADLSEAYFEGADLMAAHLEGANLGETNLDGADLSGAHLEGADLMYAHLEGADLSSAHLEGADLTATHLDGADLSGANLEGVNVVGITYDRKGKYRGIRVAACYGSPMFKRFAQDQDWLEEYLDTRKTWWQKLVKSLWWITSDYGRSIGRWVLVSLGLAILFALIYYFILGPKAFSFNAKIPLPQCGLFTMIYYSVVTFTTLGFGDITPKTLPAAGFVMAEVVLGYVMLGGLISIFATLLARRSGQ